MTSTSTAPTLGADTDALRSATELFAARGSRIGELAVVLSSTIEHTDWHGEDAAAFRGRWAGLAGALSGCSTAVCALGAQLSAEADEQDRASSAEDGDPVGGPISEALPTDREIDPEDFEHQAGEGSNSGLTITGPHGETITIGADGDGSETYSFGIEHEFEQEISVGGVEIEASVAVGEDFEVVAHPDGSLTYTFTGRATYSAEGEIDAEAVEVELGTESTTEAVYSVTVPPGTSFQDAVRINPFVPDSIPSGASVTVGSSVESSTSLEVSGAYRRIELGLGFSTGSGEGYSTVMERDADTGNLSVLSGPESWVSSGHHLSIGVEDFSFRLGQEQITSSSTLEYSEFSADPDGESAYLQTLLTAGHPEHVAPGVVDRYTETHTSSTLSSGLAVELEDVFTYDRTGNRFSDELIVREYPDGQTVWSQQVLPHGESANNSVRIDGGSGRETQWTMTLGDIPAGDVQALTESYWGTPHQGGDLQLQLDRQELAQMAEHRGIWHGDPDYYTDETHYLASMVSLDSSGGPETVLPMMYRDFNYRPIEANDWYHAELVEDTPTAPGVLLSGS